MPHINEVLQATNEKDLRVAVQAIHQQSFCALNRCSLTEVGSVCFDALLGVYEKASAALDLVELRE